MSEVLTKDELIDRLLAETQPELAEDFVAFYEGVPGTRWKQFPVFVHHIKGGREGVYVVHGNVAGLTFKQFGKPETFSDIATPPATGSRRAVAEFSARQLNANLVNQSFGTIVPANLAYYADDRLNPIQDGTPVYDVKCSACGRPSQWSARQLLEGFAKYGDKMTHKGCSGHK
jgi:hypothetical protein